MDDHTNARQMNRRAFLKTTGAVTGAAALGFPAVLRAQAKTVKVGVITPVTGPMAEVGQLCRFGAQLAVDDINAGGGIKSMGGAKLELILADTESKPEVGRNEMERVVNAGAQLVTGGFHTATVAAMTPVAQQRRVPYIIDITTSDVPTHSVAQSVREGKQKVQYVYRIFPSSTKAGPLAVKYMTEIFQETKTFPKRVVVMYTNDVFGKGQSEGFIKAVEAAKPGFEIVGVIPYPELANDLSTEVSRAKALKPDVLSPVTRPATAILLLQELAKQRVELMGIISPGAPGLNEPRQVEILKENIEYVMNNAPWPNLSNPRVQKIAEAYLKRYGKPFDTASGYTYEAILVMADALERAKSTDPDAIVDAIKKTNLDGITIASGPIRFDENGDNQNAATSIIQILKGKPLVVRPKEVAQAQVVFPRPKV